MRVCSVLMIFAFAVASASMARADSFAQNFFFFNGGSFPSGTGSFELSSAPPTSGGVVVYGQALGYDVLSFTATAFDFNDLVQVTQAGSSPPISITYDNGVLEGISYNYTGFLSNGTGNFILSGLTYSVSVTPFGAHHSTSDSGTVALAQAPTPEPSGVVLIATAALTILGVLKGDGLRRRTRRT